MSGRSAAKRGSKLVYRLTGPLPPFLVRIAPQSRVLHRFGQQLCNELAIRVTKAVAPEPFAQAQGEADNFPASLVLAGNRAEGPLEENGSLLKVWCA